MVREESNNIAAFKGLYQDQLASSLPSAGSDVQAYLLNVFASVVQALVTLDGSYNGDQNPMLKPASLDAGIKQLDIAGSKLLRIDGMQGFLDACQPNVVFKVWRDGLLYAVLPGEVGKYIAPVDCRDFATQAQAQRFFDAAGAGDPHHLDDDRDGVACE